MKTDKRGDARGRPSWGWSFVGDPGAIFFGGKRDPGTKPEEDAASEENGPQWSRARRCSGAAERTLGGEDRCESLGEGGKDLVLKDARR